MVGAGFGIGLVLLIAGVVVISLELAHPGVFLIIPGTILLVSGIGYLVIPDFLTGSLWGPVVVAGIAAISAIGSFYWYRWMAPEHRPMTTNPYSLAGTEGIVVSEVLPNSMHGKVRIRSDVWSARSPRAIPVGTRVRITGGEGVCVDVIPVEGVAA